MAFSKDRKKEIVAQYGEWIDSSQALILTEYKGLSVKDLDELRREIRKAGGEFHIVKNTLGKLAFDERQLSTPEGYFEGSTAIGFAFEDPPALAKAVTKFVDGSEFLKVKGGFLGESLMSVEEIEALAKLPPLPVVRAQLLGMIMAPATQLANIISKPARQVVTVLKAYSEKEASPEAAS